MDEPEWKPISSAPKDGTQILIYIPPCTGYSGPVPAQYAIAEWSDYCWVRGPGSAWSNGGCINVGALWMALPAPPPSTEGEPRP